MTKQLDNITSFIYNRERAQHTTLHNTTHQLLLTGND